MLVFAETSAAELNAPAGKTPASSVAMSSNGRATKAWPNSPAGRSTCRSTIAIVLGALVVSWLLRRAVGKVLRRLHSGAMERGSARCAAASPAPQGDRETSLRAEQRIEALTGMLRSLITFAVWLIAAFMILGEVGISLAPLLAGAGVLGVALGFGYQSLVRDFLSGLFILVEDQFGVGDIIDVDGEVEGVVEGVSLRTTRLRSVDGVVWYVPNGEIRRVGNMSQHWSRSLLDIEVAYDTDLERAKAVVKTVADGLWKEDQAVLEEPEMWASSSSARAASSSASSSKRLRRSSGGSRASCASGSSAPSTGRGSRSPSRSRPSGTGASRRPRTRPAASARAGLAGA